MTITTKRVDYTDPRDCADLLRLLTEYVRFEIDEVPPWLGDTPKRLAEFPTSFSVLAYADSEPIGLVNCFFGFSTFQGKRLVNIHDVIVTETHRGQGISGMMLDAVEQVARENDCCRLTLEVYANNDSAKRAYEKYGFTNDPHHPDVDVLFLRKQLTGDE